MDSDFQSGSHAKPVADTRAPDYRFLDQVKAAWALKWRYEHLHTVGAATGRPLDLNAPIESAGMRACVSRFVGRPLLDDEHWSWGMVNWAVEPFIAELLSGGVPMPRTQPFDLAALSARHFGSGAKPPYTSQAANTPP
jgi:hypothetical protein